MKLYRISQSINKAANTFDCAIVAARNHKEAATIVPCHNCGNKHRECNLSSWAPPEHVKTEFVGFAKTGTPWGTVVCSSFNAG